MYLHKFWDNWNPFKIPIYSPVNFPLMTRNNEELSAEIQVHEVDLALRKLKANTLAGMTKIVPKVLKCLNMDVRANLWNMYHT